MNTISTQHTNQSLLGYTPTSIDYKKYMVPSFKIGLVINWSGTRHLQELAQLRREIEHLAIPEDADDEEAIPPASPESIERGLNFVERMYQSILSQGEPLYLPSVFAARDGGVQLFWKIDRRQTLLIFRPNTQIVEVGLKQPGELSSRQEVSVDDALSYAIRAMRKE